MIVGAYLFGVVLLLWLYFIWSRRRFYLFALKVPGPQGLPLLGIIFRLVSKKDVLYILPTLARDYKSKTAFTWIGIVPYLYTFDPEVIEKVLTSRNCTDKTPAFEIMDKEIGPGLISSKTPRWTKHRKLLSPSFHQKVLLKFLPIFNNKSDYLLQKLDNLVGRGAFDMNDLFQRFTIQTAFATTLGVDLNEANEKDAKYMNHVQNHLKLSVERSLAPWWKVDLIFYFHKFYNSYVESRKYVHTFIKDLINKKLSRIGDVHNLQEQSEESVDITKSRRIFIDQATELYRTNLFSWKDVFIEANILVLAAFETSAATLNTALMMLAMHPQYQEKLYEEVIQVCPDRDGDVNYEDLENLVYMEMVINETLRVAATLPLLAREASTGDVKLSDEISIPQGTTILVDIFNLHRSEEIWGPNATKFNPDNFLPENVIGRHPYAFIPFSKGPRNCIGWRYAEIFLKIVLVKLVRKFRYTTDFRFEDLKFTMKMSLRCDVTPQIEVHRR